MSQVDQFLDALKRAIKAKGLTYQDLKKIMNLSESSIKRILNDKSLSLERIEKICEQCNIQFSEVCRLADFTNDQGPTKMTADQELGLSKNSRLLHLFLLISDGYSLKKITKAYDIQDPELTQLLIQLDRLKLIELHPNNRIKLLFPSTGLFFNRDGAIGKTLFAQVQNQFLNHDFRQSQDFLRFTQVHFTQETFNKFKKKLEKITNEALEESQLLVQQKEQVGSSGFLFAIRDWKYSSLDSIKKR